MSNGAEIDDSLNTPKPTTVFQWGVPVDLPKQEMKRESDRHKYQFAALTSDSARDEGMLWLIQKRKRVRSNQDQPYYVRIVAPNPNGMFYAQWNQGKFRIETRSQWVQRKLGQQNQ
mmetsp:Transcript_4022/g.7057  ORF Transcript_4022/g.7057 Transcript_4022/m.7057 type:complete len:116 (-) Transcript_4022:1315-1662(-)